MAKVTALGLSKIEVADIDPTTGLAKGEYSTLGKTYENTCKLTEDDPEETEFYCEEEDDPQETISKRGKTKLAFSIMNANAKAFSTIFGGTYTEKTGDTPAFWESPDQLVEVEKYVKITPRIGGVVEIRRLKMRAKVNADYSKKGLFLVEVSGTVMTPLVAGVKRMKYSDPS